MLTTPGAPRDPWHRVVFDPATVLFTIGATEVTLAGAAAVAGLAGAGLSAAGAVQQGRQAEALGAANARAQEQQAAATRGAAAFEEERLRERQRALKSEQRAVLGAAGTTLEGSPLLAMAEDAAAMELDALALRHSGSLEEARARGQAALDRWDGNTARRNSYWKGSARLLDGATVLASRWPGKSSSRGVGPQVEGKS